MSAVSLAAAVIMLLLFVSEVVYWRSVRVEDHLVVDRSMSDRDFDISLDVTFHVLPCKGEGCCGEAAGLGLAPC